MPNWCSNTLKIAGPEGELERFKKAAQGENGELDFNSFIPYPEKYKRQDEWARDMQKRLNVMPEHEREIYIKLNGSPKGGYNQGGYDWCSNAWGTKWNACEAELSVFNGELQYYFNTAWSPPEPVIEAMSQQFPALSFDLHYEEPGNNFAGDLKCSGGQIVEHNDYEYPHSEDDEDEEEEAVAP